MNATPRITLSDFHALQSQLLATKARLLESEAANAKLSEELSKLRAKTMPAPPPFRGGSSSTTSGGATYPSALNPFGEPVARTDSSAQTDAASSLEQELHASLCAERDARRAAEEEARRLRADVPSSPAPPPPAPSAPPPPTELVLAERRAGVDRGARSAARAALRLAFHGWRHAHASTRLLRNMSSIAQLVARTGGGGNAGGGGEGLRLAASVACLQKELRSGDADAARRARADADAARRATAERTLAAAELAALEGEVGRTRQALRAESGAGGDAMRDLAQTLAAAHSCALTALEASEMRVAEFEAGRGAKLAASCRRVLDGGGSEETAPT